MGSINDIKDSYWNEQFQKAIDDVKPKNKVQDTIVRMLFSFGMGNTARTYKNFIFKEENEQS